jgi:CheY-like chemotaxis protein
MNSQYQPTILLVDDDPMVMEALTYLFGDEYSTLSADSGEQAIELVRENPAISAVILDIRMAGMGGVEACRQLRLIRPELPVIINTAGHPDIRPLLKKLELEPFAFVTKEDSVKNLLRVVRSACNADDRQN